jgi:hypothetical protein
MSNDLEKPLPYEYTFGNDKNNSYFFVTENKLAYLVKFKPTDYFFSENLGYNSHTFEFIIEVYENPIGKTPPLDGRTAATVAKIFIDFFDRSDKTIAVYICDSSDSRQFARKRKFNLWFEAFNTDNRYVKVDTSIIDNEGIYYPVSIMVRKDNPNAGAILSEFVRVIQGISKG